MVYVFSLLLLATPPLLEDDYSVDELLTIHEQNRNSFVSIELDCNWSKRPSDELSKSIQAQIENLKNVLESDDLPVEFTKLIKSEAKPGVSFQEAKQLFIKRHEKSKTAVLIKVAAHYFFQMTPEIVDVHIYINDALDNPRKEYSIKRGLKSFTGGDFKHLQRKKGDKWIGLDPYPRVNRAEPVAWTRSTLLIESLLPPFLNSPVLETKFPTPFESLWDHPEKIKYFGSWTSTSGDVLQLLVKPIDDSNFELLAIDPSKGAMPIWSSKMQCIDDNSVESLTSEIVSELANQVVFFQDNSITNSRKEAVPLNIIFYDDYNKVKNAGWYPFEITYKTILLLYSAESLKKNLDWKETPFGVAEIGTLKINSLHVNDSVSKSEPLKLADGTAFYDFDTKRSSMMGESPDRAMDRLLKGQKKSKTLTILIVVNVAAILIILVILLLRKRSKNINHLDG